MTELEELVLGELKSGYKNAMPGATLATLVGFPSGKDRAVRVAILSLARQGHPILSSIKPPYGYYYAETIDEVNEYLKILLKRIKGDCRRYKYIKNASGRVLHPGQLRLGV